MSARTLDDAAPVRTRPFPRRRVALLAGAVLLALAAGVLGWRWWTNWRFFETTDDAYVGGNVTAIAPHIAGFVATIAVADPRSSSSRVRMGTAQSPVTFMMAF